MSYNNQCVDSGFNCTRIQYWSNPDVLYSGVATGIPEGQANPADNSMVLDNTAYTVANFRQTICTDLPVRIDQTGTGYSTIQSGYNNAATNQTIMIRQGNYNENLLFDNSVNVALAGGYNCGFSTISGVTTVTGSMTIARGLVCVDKLTIK
jgi:hypothetical protein